MSGWFAAIIAVIIALMYVTWQAEAVDRERERADKAEALLDGIEQQREITRKYDEIDRDLNNGGKEGLSDYMRDAAGKLWP